MGGLVIGLVAGGACARADEWIPLIRDNVERCYPLLLERALARLDLGS